MYKKPGPCEYKKNNYRSRPAKDKPDEIFNYNWARIKRDIALGVLNEDLPLSAIEETEYAAEFAAQYERMVADLGNAEGQTEFESVEPLPMHAAAFSADAAEMDEAEASWRVSGVRGYMPAQTGSPGADMGYGHMMRRRRDHLVAQRHATATGYH